MIVIIPQPVTDISLLASSVAEADGVAVYSAASTYTAGQKVRVVSPSITAAAAILCTPGTPALFNWIAHGLINGTPVLLSTSGTLPIGLLAGVIYYLSATVADSFCLSASKNGAALDISSAGTGNLTITAQVHKVYQALQAVPVNKPPLQDIAVSGGFWLNQGATNRWKMFDESVTSQTSVADRISLLFQASGRVDSVAILNISAATAKFAMLDAANAKAATVSIATPAVIACAAHGRSNGDKVRLTTTGALPTGLAAFTTYYVVNATADTLQLSATFSGSVINTSGMQSGVHTLTYVPYEVAYQLTSDSGVSAWYGYYFEPITRRGDYVEVDMPPYNNAQIEVILSAPGETVLCGACVIGKRRDIGKTNLGATIGITDYSVKTRDEFGDFRITERAYSKRGDFQVWVDNGYTGELQRLLAQYRATPLVYIGGQSLGATISYGFYRDFTINIAYSTQSTCNISIEALT